MSVQNPNTFEQANLDKNNPNLYQTNLSLQQGQQPAGRVIYIFYPVSICINQYGKSSWSN